MASKKTTKKLTDGAAKGSVKMKLQPAYDGQTFPTAYSNFASVTHTTTELCVDFCLIAPPHKVGVERDKATAHVPVVSRIFMPPDLADGLIKALRAQLGQSRKEKAMVFRVPKKANGKG